MSQILGKLTGKALALTADDLKIYLKQNSFFITGLNRIISIALACLIFCVLLFRTVVKASVILLPLLGVTWVLGLFAVNQNTIWFAWLFTIFNSLQVRTFVVSLEPKYQLDSVYK